MDRAKVMKTSILMLLMVVLIVGYYSYLAHRNEQANSQQNAEDTVNTEMTAVQELLAKAKYKDYPATPVQVVKYYNEITACFYNETYNDAELEELAKLAQTLYDLELVANQTYADYISGLKDEIAVFKSGNITVYESIVSPATDVEYFEHDGYSCAKLYCTYTLKSGTVYQSSREVYILRKDANEHWKIMGFDLVKED